MTTHKRTAFRGRTVQKEESSKKPEEICKAEDFYKLLDNSLSLKQYSRRRETVHDSVRSLAQWIHGAYGTSVPSIIKQIIAQIDGKLQDQVNEILHHPDFQCLESTWRGIDYVIKSTDGDESIEVDVLDVSKKELTKDLGKYATDVLDSTVFRLLYTERIGTLGGKPYNIIVGDYYFSNDPSNQNLLSSIKVLATTSFAPFIAGASPALFGANTFSETTDIKHLKARYKKPEYAWWRGVSKFRSPRSSRYRSDSRFFVLTAPRVLARRRYGTKKDEQVVEDFRFEEDAYENRSNYCWMNSSFLFGALVIREFRKTGGFSSIESTSDRVIKGLPVHVLEYYEKGIPNQIGPTEAPISIQRERELREFGVVALISREDRHDMAFSQPVTFFASSSESDTNTHLQTISSVLSSARLMHSTLRIVRERDFRSREDCEDFLNLWLSGFVTKDSGVAARLDQSLFLRKASAEIATAEYQLPGEFTLTLGIEPWSVSGESGGLVALSYSYLTRMEWVNSHERSIGVHGIASLATGERGTLATGVTYVLDVLVTGNPFADSTTGEERKSTVADFLEYRIGVRADAMEIRPAQIRTFIWQNSIPLSPIQFLIRPLRPGREIMFIDYYLGNHWLKTAELLVEVL
jgi:type VI secretion system protein ImpC